MKEMVWSWKVDVYTRNKRSVFILFRKDLRIFYRPVVLLHISLLELSVHELLRRDKFDKDLN